MTSFLFLLMWKYLISPLLLKDSFAGYRISSLSFFSLSTLTMSSLPSHLHGFWWEISCWYSWGSLEFVMNCFSIQDSLFVFGFGQFNYVSRTVFWVYPTCSLLSFFDVQINAFNQTWGVFLFNQIWEVFTTVSPGIHSAFFPPVFWDLHYAYIYILCDVPQVSEISFFFISLCVPPLDNSNWSTFKLGDSSACLSLMLSSSSEFLSHLL